MRRSWRGCLGALLLAPLLAYFLVPPVLARYDLKTRETILRIIRQDLPPQASMAEMDRFMRRHTEVHSFTSAELNGLPDHEFGGRLAQTNVDKLLFDRKVFIRLKVDRRTKTLKAADVSVSYTFL